MKLSNTNKQGIRSCAIMSLLLALIIWFEFTSHPAIGRFSCTWDGFKYASFGVKTTPLYPGHYEWKYTVLRLGPITIYREYKT